jgi:uncharacterized RDD family membrane protein YckC
MNRSFHRLLLITLLACCGVAQLAGAQDQATPPAPPAPVEPGSEPQLDIERAEQEIERAEADIERMERKIQQRLRRAGRHKDNVIVNINDDSSLAAGEYADSVVSVFGNATSAGEIGEVLLAINGNATSTGSVGEAVIAMLGDVYVDGEVGEDVVAMLGNITLGPNAVIHGELVSVGGTITRDPSSVVHGGQQQIAFGRHLTNLDWLKPWLECCAVYGRPLAFQEGIGWAWWLAAGFLGFYVLLSLLFDQGVQRVVTTLEERPLQSVLASVIAVVLSPVLMFVMLITVVGAALIPFVLLGLFCATLFGKAAVLATLGRRITRFTGAAPFGHIAIATLVGGLIVMLFYTVPGFGFILMNLLGALGLGVVVYTLLLAMRSNQAPARAAANSYSTPEGTAGVASAVAGDATAPTGAAGDASAAGPTGETGGTSAAAPAGAAGSMPPPSSPAATVGPSNIELAALPRAGFWIRMGALALDMLLIGIVVNVLDPSEHFFALVLASYGALMWKLRGTTIGGIICNLRVVRTDGRDIEWETAIVRALGCFLSAIPLGLGFFWIAFDSNRQAWHDKIAGTVVVRVPKSQPLT